MAMIDLTPALQDPELGYTTFTVERSTWKRNQGETTLLTKTTTPATGCIHPGTPETLQQLPEEDRHEDHIIIYTIYPLSLGFNAGLTFTTPDRILWQNQIWRVVQVKEWSTFGYVRALAIRVQEDS